jgi:hypothetical protein
MTTTELMHREIAWYKTHGKYPNERVRNGYVIGDWWWNQTCPHQREIIEPRMARHLEFEAEQSKTKEEQK